MEQQRQILLQTASYRVVRFTVEREVCINIDQRNLDTMGEGYWKQVYNNHDPMVNNAAEGAERYDRLYSVVNGLFAQLPLTRVVHDDPAPKTVDTALGQLPVVSKLLPQYTFKLEATADRLQRRAMASTIMTSLASAPHLISHHGTVELGMHVGPDVVRALEVLFPEYHKPPLNLVEALRRLFLTVAEELVWQPHGA